MTDDLSHRLSSIADELERAARGKSAEDLHELFAKACVVMREGAEAVRGIQFWREAVRRYRGATPGRAALQPGAVAEKEG